MKQRIVDLDNMKVDPARRIALTDRELCRQCGIESDLMRALVRARAMHKAGPCETAIFGGLCSEEVAALAISSYLIQREGMPIDVASHLVSQLSHALLEATKGLRVVAIIIEQNKGSQVAVQGGRGDIEIPKALAPYTTLIDATVLRDRYEEALGDSTLKFPKPKEAIVKR